jgi:hypothetical protein
MFALINQKNPGAGWKFIIGRYQDFIGAIERVFQNQFEPIPKNGVWFKVEEEAKRQPEEYMKYFEDWLFASDNEIGPYNFFGMGSSYLLGWLLNRTPEA